MSHAHIEKLDVHALLDVEPIKVDARSTTCLWYLVGLGVLTFCLGLIYDPTHLWGAYYVCLTFFMGLAVGSVVLTAIFQIVRARWSAPISRIAEANVAFLPWVYLLWAATYFGKEHLFPWATQPMPGKELWMQPNFVYCRFAVLLALLFLLLWKFVKLSLRGDVGVLREFSKRKELWVAPCYVQLSKDWEGSDEEIAKIQPKRSRMAPVVVILYGVIYSLFVFEMLMTTDPIWYANMFGGFEFVGNIYLAWAVLGLTVTYYISKNADYEKVVTTQQFWDMGKMTFAFCMLWGYMFFAQFLPQWYGNLPEETQWMILRTKEFPWKGVSWVVFSMAFIMPFILLLSRDLKKTPKYFCIVCSIICLGLFGEKYVIIMPQLSPHHFPIGLTELGLFCGFLGAYLLATRDFVAKFPFVQLSHPASVGKTDW